VNRLLNVISEAGQGFTMFFVLLVMVPLAILMLPFWPVYWLCNRYIK
jgi:Tfp pilus assembly protein PilX